MPTVRKSVTSNMLRRDSGGLSAISFGFITVASAIVRIFTVEPQSRRNCIDRPFTLRWKYALTLSLFLSDRFITVNLAHLSLPLFDWLRRRLADLLKMVLFVAFPACLAVCRTGFSRTIVMAVAVLAAVSAASLSRRPRFSRRSSQSRYMSCKNEFFSNSPFIQSGHSYNLVND